MPFSGKSTLAPVLRAGMVCAGIMYGSWKLSSLRAAGKAASQKDAKGH